MTVQHLTSLEKETDGIKAIISEFEIEISCCFKEEKYLTYEGSNPNPEDWSRYLKYDPYFQEEFDSIINNFNVPEADADFMPDLFDDTYLNMELVIPRYGDGPNFGKLEKRLRDKDGLPIVISQNNPIMYTIMYKVEYKDCHKASLTVNVIAENMFFQVNVEVNWHVLFQDIFDHGYDGAEVKDQGAFVTTRNGKNRCREKTKGVEFVFQ